MAIRHPPLSEYRRPTGSAISVSWGRTARIRAPAAACRAFSGLVHRSESGIDVRWTVEQRRGEKIVSRQSLDIASGFLG